MSAPLGSIPTLTLHVTIFDNTRPREAHARCTVSPNGIICDRFAGGDTVQVLAELNQPVIGVLLALLDATAPEHPSP